MIKYISTRGQAPDLAFDDVLLTGLAIDGGLYVPDSLPQISMKELHGLSYVDTAKAIIPKFIGDVLSAETLDHIIEESYSTFTHKHIAPLVHLHDNIYVLEQFHGPTLAFKDFALQFLGRIFDAVLNQKHQHITIVGATSGDTGSAAIEGCRGRKNMDIFILHPYGRVSNVQRRQMTTIMDGNVHNIAIKGSFDDCQDLVKDMFGDQEFRKKIGMSAVNSINWARIMAQIVYYFYAAAQLSDRHDKVSFSVPTGNFGNIYAGYLARKMGAPIEHLIVATNHNDILYRFLQTGIMKMETVKPSLSPSMDIQISSNFERLLFDLYDRDADKTKAAMMEFRENGEFKIEDDALLKMKMIFKSDRSNDNITKHVIHDTYKRYNYMLDPHSATGIHAADVFADDDRDTPIVCMATAHPAKFPDAVEQATNVRPPLPMHMTDLYDREERYKILENDINEVKKYILETIG